MIRRLPALAMLAALLLAAGGAYAYGRATAPEPTPVDAACTDARTAAEDLIKNADADTEQAREDTLTAAQVIVDNPGCFGAEHRAVARRALDRAALDAAACEMMDFAERAVSDC